MFRRMFVALGLVLLSATVASAHGVQSHFRVEVDGAPGAAVSGHLVNTYGQRAEHVWIAVDGLDTAGKVVGTTTAYVGQAPNFDRVYFPVPTVPGAVAYRGRVTSFDCLAF